jgi:adenylate cyclase
MTGASTRTPVEWLVDGARSAPRSDEVLAQLCDRMVACGIPLYRVAVFVRSLHPQIMGRAFRWRHGQGVSVSAARHELTAEAEFIESPVARIYATLMPIRRRLADPACPLDFQVLGGLRAEGITDYLASPLLGTFDNVHVATWTTRAAGGFTDADIAGIEAVVPPLARVAEFRALDRTAGNLLDTYVGHQAGQRILAGRVRRGDTEQIHAVIWLSDMRGFTTLADRLPPKGLVDLLNRFFDCQVPPIVERGGEVLKFMGDGMLAIFPLAGDGSNTGAVCREVLAAARAARSNVAAMDHPSSPEKGCGMGIALHLGDVLYGNIGGGDRLDFTCIGPAVNLAARLEKLAGELGRVTLASAEFARHCPSEVVPIGEFKLRGFGAPQIVFGLADESACTA